VGQRRPGFFERVKRLLGRKDSASSNPHTDPYQVQGAQAESFAEEQQKFEERFRSHLDGSESMLGAWERVLPYDSLDLLYKYLKHLGGKEISGHAIYDMMCLEEEQVARGLYDEWREGHTNKEGLVQNYRSDFQKNSNWVGHLDNFNWELRRRGVPHHIRRPMVRNLIQSSDKEYDAVMACLDSDLGQDIDKHYLSLETFGGEYGISEDKISGLKASLESRGHPNNDTEDFLLKLRRMRDPAVVARAIHWMLDSPEKEYRKEYQDHGPASPPPGYSPSSSSGSPPVPPPPPENPPKSPQASPKPPSDQAPSQVEGVWETLSPKISLQKIHNRACLLKPHLSKIIGHMLYDLICQEDAHQVRKLSDWFMGKSKVGNLESTYQKGFQSEAIDWWDGLDEFMDSTKKSGISHPARRGMVRTLICGTNKQESMQLRAEWIEDRILRGEDAEKLVEKASAATEYYETCRSFGGKEAASERDVAFAMERLDSQAGILDPVTRSLIQREYRVLNPVSAEMYIQDTIKEYEGGSSGQPSPVDYYDTDEE